MTVSESSEKPGGMLDPAALERGRRISVAPMMDYTDRHCRYFLRLLSPSAVLYTEMITSAALVRGKDVERLLAFDASEHPVVLQLGGSDPQELALAARMGEQAGYDEINLNCGCPSDRVRSGRFGACLMGEPVLVADCVAAMRAAVTIPVTVKCRIGIDPMPVDAGDEQALLYRFITQVAAAGCEEFVMHARSAVLGGLSPKQNREIPPLRYEIVHALRAQFPKLRFIINGGICTLADTLAQLQHCDGVMIGRQAYAEPYLLAQLHAALVDPDWAPSREAVIAQYAEYVSARLKEGHRLRGMVKHALGLYLGLPGARSWRRFLSERCAEDSADAQLLLDSLRIVQREAA